ncbi:hypothetical protein RRG08_060224 [Elysia crispata]|uniref:Uncharacterized protein n=1 Tax=Elysia crispata TaxID=231223 RepID=A0AAE0ZVY1_9GAST|nr:hypothetical protein RRG08_060224 [Elysia crispata]
MEPVQWRLDPPSGGGWPVQAPTQTDQVNPDLCLLRVDLTLPLLTLGQDLESRYIVILNYFAKTFIDVTVERRMMAIDSSKQAEYCDFWPDKSTIMSESVGSCATSQPQSHNSFRCILMSNRDHCEKARCEPVREVPMTEQSYGKQSQTASHCPLL